MVTRSIQRRSGQALRQCSGQAPHRAPPSPGCGRAGGRFPACRQAGLPTTPSQKQRFRDRRTISRQNRAFQGKRAGVAAPDLVSGQAMLLTVVMTGGILFLVTSVAGILMFYQLQAMTDIGNSAAALFAADATLEKAVYEYLNSYAYVYEAGKTCFTDSTRPCTGPSLQLSNGASGSSYLMIPPPATEGATTTITAEGRGPGGRTIRLLQTTFLINPSTQ